MTKRDRNLTQEEKDKIADCEELVAKIEATISWIENLPLRVWRWFKNYR